MRSLQSRLVLAASLALAAFLGLGGFALDRSFRDSAQTAVHRRLQADIYALLAAADVNAAGVLHMPPRLFDERLQRPGSGLYGQVVDAGGRSLWRSGSELGKPLPAPAPLPPGTWRFRRVDAAGGQLFQLSFGVAWDTDRGGTRRYTFSVSEDLAGFDAEVERFRRSLLVWLGAAAVVLLLLQGTILRWSLTPLRRAVRDLNAIQSGAQARLEGTYPRELQGLTDNLNALLESERRQLGRYRDGLADLAHSLKTPLAVLRGALQGGNDDELRAAVSDQTERMNLIVDYQLQRAATSGRTALMAPVAVEPVVRRVLDSLAKVYRDKGVRSERSVPADACFHGDEGDLMELLGNLIDNAYKWCGSVVRVSLEAGPARELVLTVEDDGPGVPADKARLVLNRGERADPGVSGHGIGLAVVQDIARAYHGGIDIDASPLGGACIRVRLQAG
ncbi:MAG TPA: ATP-binding protein [Gammaproteobacteria bacterium]|nr:ATP-binding protein [Gammaproteobacteria bacterium]